MRTFGGCGERTDFIAAPDAVTPVGNEPINGIGEEGWNQAEESGDGGPGLRQLAEGGKDSARANEDLGLLGERLTDDQN